LQSRYRLLDRVEYICAAAGSRRTLHIGCTNWPYTQQSIDSGSLLHQRLGACTSSLVGLDPDASGASLLNGAGLGPVIVGDIEQVGRIADDPELRDKFDVIVFGEVIEHLNNPGLALTGLKLLLRPGGVVVLTTINAYCAFRFLQFATRGKGGTQEPVHPDHVAYYSPSTLSLLARRHGYTVKDLAFYDLGPEHRPFSRRRITIVNDIAVKLSPQLADGLVMTLAVAD
jgi:SAM-dependent methyltransferase